MPSFLFLSNPRLNEGDEYVFQSKTVQDKIGKEGVSRIGRRQEIS